MLGKGMRVDEAGETHACPSTKIGPQIKEGCFASIFSGSMQQPGFKLDLNVDLPARLGSSHSKPWLDQT
jgi:hypothetical protein